MVVKEKNCNILGLDTEEIAGLSIDELINNKVAIKMLLHYYQQIRDENTNLKVDLNTLQTYVQAYERNKTNTSVGVILLTISNICVGFGINFLTNKTYISGGVLMTVSLVLIAAGIYFSYVKERE